MKPTSNPLGAKMLTDEQIIDAIKSVCDPADPSFPGALIQFRAETIAIGRAVERALLSASKPADHSQCCDTAAYCSSVRRCTAKDAAAPAQSGEAVLSGHVVEEMFLRWSEWTTELGEAISRKNIDGFVTELRNTLTAPQSAQPAKAGDTRFFIDHGVVHDRSTGKHVTLADDGDPEKGLEICCALLNSLAEPKAAVVLDGERAAIPLAWQSTFDGLLAYVLQDDLHNRLTPRVIDIAYTAFMSGASGKNKDDGGPCDWFNDTKPAIQAAIVKLSKDLTDARAASPQAAEKTRTLTFEDRQTAVEAWEERIIADGRNITSREAACFEDGFEACRALLAAASPQASATQTDARHKAVEQLHKFLNAAGAEGLILDGVDGGDLFMSIFDFEDKVDPRFAQAAVQSATGSQ